MRIVIQGQVGWEYAPAETFAQPCQILHTVKSTIRDAGGGEKPGSSVSKPGGGGRGAAARPPRGRARSTDAPDTPDARGILRLASCGPVKPPRPPGPPVGTCPDGCPSPDDRDDDQTDDRPASRPSDGRPASSAYLRAIEAIAAWHAVEAEFLRVGRIDPTTDEFSLASDAEWRARQAARDAILVAAAEGDAWLVATPGAYGQGEGESEGGQVGGHAAWRLPCVIVGGVGYAVAGTGSGKGELVKLVGREMVGGEGGGA